jgi:hypothetical protein
MNQNNSREEIENILYAPNLNITQREYCAFIDEVVPKILSLHHQELQKARQDWLREEIESFRTEMKNYPMVNEPEWRRGYIEALQDQVDRYQSELDQPNT